jgi:hypothetical protein
MPVHSITMSMPSSPQGRFFGSRSASHLDRVAAFDGDGVAIDLTLREAAVNRVVAHQVGVGFDRAEIVDRDDVDVGAAGFVNRAHDIAADASKPVDGNLGLHSHSAISVPGQGFAVRSENHLAWLFLRDHGLLGGHVHWTKLCVPTAGNSLSFGCGASWMPKCS